MELYLWILLRLIRNQLFILLIVHFRIFIPVYQEVKVYYIKHFKS
jgi:hypothetical protein